MAFASQRDGRAQVPVAAIGPFSWRKDLFCCLHSGQIIPHRARHPGYEILQIIGESQENRRVLDQVMDKDGIEIDREIRRSVSNLFE